jgi:hypothetical protein
MMVVDIIFSFIKLLYIDEANKENNIFIMFSRKKELGKCVYEGFNQNMECS